LQSQVIACQLTTSTGVGRRLVLTVQVRRARSEASVALTHLERC